MRACVCAFVNLFFKKTSQKLLTGLLPNFIVVFLRWRLKSSLHRNRKIRPVERYKRSSASSLKHDDTATRNAVCDKNMLKELEGIYNPSLGERLDKSIVSKLIGTEVKFGMGVKKKV